MRPLHPGGTNRLAAPPFPVRTHTCTGFLCGPRSALLQPLGLSVEDGAVGERAENVEQTILLGKNNRAEPHVTIKCLETQKFLSST